MELDDARPFLRRHQHAALAAVDSDGYPHVTRVVFALGDDDLIRVSVTADRVKTRHLQVRRRATLHVRGDDDWHWVSVVADVDLSPVAKQVDDAVVDELLETYEDVAGPHDDPDDFRRAMVADHRLVLRLRPRRLYGILGD